MKKILEYLIEKASGVESFLLIQENQLYLRYEYIDISIIFDNLDEVIGDDFCVPLDEISLSEICTIPIKKIVIQKGAAIYHDNNVRDEYLDYYEPYTMMAYELIHKINSRFKSGVDDYRVTAYCIGDGCSMCDEIYDYGFQIDICSMYWDSWDFFQYVVEVLDKEKHNLAIPSFYDTDRILSDNYEINLLSTNTKTRRLGYLKILLSMFQNNPQIPIIKLATSFERLCQRYDYCREQYKNTKGNVIETKHGSSAMPYIELAQKLGLILKGATTYRLGKSGKIYTTLFKDCPFEDSNPFILNITEKVFFGEIFLREDYLFIYSILEQASIHTKITFKSLKDIFKEILLNKIGIFIDVASIKKMPSINHLQLVKRQITQWDDRSSYLEHIIMPRINWLYDLDYITLNKDLSFQLTETGRRLLLNLTSWNDISLWAVCSPSSYLDTYYMKMMNDIFELKMETWEDTNVEMVIRYLEESMSLFRTLAPNRITYSLFISYLKYSSFARSNLIIDEYDIRALLESKKIPSYILKFQPQYKDGYIQKINH